MNVFIEGFLAGLALIVAIGAQNMFVIRQGLLKQHVLLIALMFSLSDAFLIFTGVYGLHAIKSYVPLLEPIMKYAGALFLIIYGAMSFHNAIKRSATISLDEEEAKTSVKTTILLCLAFTWLNPHVYLDTVLLLGSLANQHPNHEFNFAIGATCASIFLFFSLGFGARLLRPLFVKPIAWKILDAFTGVIMWVIAVKLLLM